ncbi:hypothetical protein BT93_I0906 [Corymbia citriodora subsp. variegata]|nr:hypothetical protein BT93_I0906 [Corymbia citriodora subsp. variegata]
MPPCTVPSSHTLAQPLPPPPAPPPPPSLPPPPPPPDPTRQYLIFAELFTAAVAFGTFVFFIFVCCSTYARWQRNRNRGHIARAVGRLQQQRFGAAHPQNVVVEYRGDERKFDMDECVICLEDFEEGDQCGVLGRCGHVYHESCIKQWLSRHWHCPLCRRTVRVTWAGRVAPAPPASSSRNSSTSPNS